MTKADLVERVADAVRPQVTKRECGLVVDALLDAVKDALVRGDRIELRGFGIFRVHRRKARKAFNPRTGEPVEVPPRDVPVFKPSTHLRDRVEQGRAARAHRDRLAPGPSRTILRERARRERGGMT
ncbi:MAG: integration host factor subunit beta [Gemmatimonadota bacterium]|nr:integration host factor subunit beta [Gemmatimonadota bacterium]MDE2871587.1 integration host factor subunit beta [Gemmatimonadota bacterium]